MPSRRIKEAREYFEERYPEGHGAKLRSERRKFATETAEDLAGSRMAETERAQKGQTMRRGMMEAGAMARAKLGGGKGTAGGFTASQMANLRKSAYGAADKDIERRRSLMQGEKGAFGLMGEKGEWTPFTEEQIAGERESIADKYLQGYLGGQQTQPGEAKGYGTLSTAGGRTFDVLGEEITERPGDSTVSSARTGLNATNLSAGPTKWTKPGATTRGTAAKRLASEYKKATAPPIIGAKTLGRISQAWKTRKKATPVEAPLKLRGMY